MTLAQLITAVYTETNRPDLVDETLQKILFSTLKMHNLDFFFKDIQTAEVIFDTAAYLQVLDTSSIPRFRSISYLRKNDPTLSVYQQNPTILPPLFSLSQQSVAAETRVLTIIAPDDIFDEFGAEKYDVAYQAGNNICIKSSTSLQYVLAGWYKFPNLDTAVPANFDSWIAVEHPYAIVYDAASAILQTIGMNEASRKFDDPRVGLATVAIQQLINSNIVAKGY